MPCRIWTGRGCVTCLCIRLASCRGGSRVRALHVWLTLVAPLQITPSNRNEMVGIATSPQTLYGNNTLAITFLPGCGCGCYSWAASIASSHAQQARHASCRMHAASCCLRPLTPACPSEPPSGLPPTPWYLLPPGARAGGGAGPPEPPGQCPNGLAAGPVDSKQARHSSLAGGFSCMPGSAQRPSMQCMYMWPARHAAGAAVDSLRPAPGGNQQQASDLQCASPLLLQREVGIPADLRRACMECKPLAALACTAHACLGVATVTVGRHAQRLASCWCFSSAPALPVRQASGRQRPRPLGQLAS